MKKNNSIYEANQFFVFILFTTIFFIIYLSIGNECRQLKIEVNHTKRVNNDIMNKNKILKQEINALKSNKYLNVWADKFGMVQAPIETLFIEVDL